MNKAVIYARYSSHNQTETSIDGQLRICEDFAKREGFHIVGKYIDRATTGTNDKRPDFQKMIADSCDKWFDTVIIYRFDRFSRDTYHTAIYKYQLKNNGVRILSATENIPDNPTGIILEAMIVAMAEYFSIELSEKVRRGMKEIGLKRQYHGAGIPIGYKVNPDTKLFEVDYDTAHVVQKIFKLYIDGVKLVNICKTIENLGYMTAKGTPYTREGVRCILRNPHYIGTYRCGDIVEENAFEPIIDLDVWEKVQEKIEQNARIPAHNKATEEYLLTGSAVCGCCDMPLIGDSCARRGNTYRYYKCRGKLTKGTDCKKATVKKNWLEGLVADVTIEYMGNPDALKKIAAKCAVVDKLIKEENSELQALQKQLKETQKQQENIINALAQGIIAKGVQQKLEDLERTEETLKDAIARSSCTPKGLTPADIMFFTKQLQDATHLPTLERQKQIIDTFVAGVKLYDDKIVIAFNITNPDKTLHSAVFSLLDDDNLVELDIMDKMGNATPSHPHAVTKSKETRYTHPQRTNHTERAREQKTDLSTHQTHEDSRATESTTENKNPRSLTR